MTNMNIPRLCGGTFFLQILRTKKSSTRTKDEGRRGIKDEVNNQRILESLILFFDPEFKTPPGGDSFKKSVSGYRYCAVRDVTGTPFTGGHVSFQKFDTAVKSNDKHIISLMKGFIDKYIQLDRNKIYPVIYTLLQTVKDDITIADSDIFYMGKPITKAELVQETTITLETFLLGLWHFIVLNRENNLVGRDTIESWTIGDLKKRNRKYIGKTGEDYPIKITVQRLNGQTFKETDFSYEEEVLEEDTEEYESEEDNSPEFIEYKQFFQSLQLTQTVNNFFGTPGSTQINNNFAPIYMGSIAPVLPEVRNTKIDKDDYYHLLVGYESKERILVDTERALTEYISDDVKNTFSLDDTDRMSGIQMLLMPEIQDTEKEQTAMVGMLTKVKKQDNGVVLYIQNGPTFPSVKVKENMELFGINHIFELNRTHWTIKKINLKEAMEDAGL